MSRMRMNQAVSYGRVYVKARQSMFTKLAYKLGVMQTQATDVEITGNVQLAILSINLLGWEQGGLSPVWVLKLC